MFSLYVIYRKHILQKYIKENPFYERRRKLDRAAASENPVSMSEPKPESKPMPDQRLDDKAIVIDSDVNSKTTSVLKASESDNDDVMIFDYTDPTNDSSLKSVKKLAQQREKRKRRRVRLAEAKEDNEEEKASNLVVVSEIKASNDVLAVEDENNVSTTVTNAQDVKEVNERPSNIDSTAKISSDMSHAGKGASKKSIGGHDNLPCDVKVLKVKTPFSPSVKSSDVISSNSAPNVKPTCVKPLANVPDVKAPVTNAPLHVPNVQSAGKKQDVSLNEKNPDVKISGLSGKEITGEKITVKVSDMKLPTKFTPTRLAAKSVIVPVVTKSLSDRVMSKPASFPVVPVSIPSVTKDVCDPISINSGTKIDPKSTVQSQENKQHHKKEITEDISNTKSVETAESKSKVKVPFPVSQVDKPKNPSMHIDVVADELGEDTLLRMEIVWPSEAETPCFANVSVEKETIKSDQVIPVQATQSKSVPFSVKTETNSDHQRSVPFPAKKEMEIDGQVPVPTVEAKSVPFSVKAKTDSDHQVAAQVAQSKSCPFPVKKEIHSDRQSPVQAVHSRSVPFPVQKTAKSAKPEVKKMKSPVKRKVPFPVKRDAPNANTEQGIPFPIAKTVPFAAKKEKVIPFPVAKTAPFPVENKEQPTPEEAEALVAIDDPYSDIDGKYFNSCILMSILTIIHFFAGFVGSFIMF